MRARVAGILSLCLLLLSSFGATSALAGAAPPAASPQSGLAILIGTGSCTGTDACAGAVGPIGDNSCNGTEACADTMGSIGDNSCNGDGACVSADGNIGDYACNGDGICEDQVAAVDDCTNNDVTPAACLLPDGRIRRIGKHNMVGNNIYNTDGTNQTLTDTLGDRAVRFVITIQNDGHVADSFTIGASTSAFLIPGPAVRFYQGWPAQDISSAVWTSSYTTPTIAPGDVYRIRAVVRPSPINLNHLAAGPGVSHYSWLVTATSVGNSTQKDAVRFGVDVPFN